MQSLIMIILKLAYVSSIAMQCVMIFCEVMNFTYKLSFTHIDPYKIISLFFYVIEFGILFTVFYYDSQYIKPEIKKMPTIKEEVQIGVYEILQLVFILLRFMSMMIHIK